MITLCADLSSRLTGIVIAETELGEIIKMRSAPIVRPVYNPESLGYCRSKKKLPSRPGSNDFTNTYYKTGETHVSKAEKKRRDVQVREAENLYVLNRMSKEMWWVIEKIKPDVVVYEKNATFNSVLTTALLAKVAGTLIGIASAIGADIIEYRVQTVRKVHNPARLVKEFVKGKTEEELLKIPDITKAALREKMQEKYGKYGLELHTYDEGDAAVVWDHYYETTLKERYARK